MSERSIFPVGDKVKCLLYPLDDEHLVDGFYLSDGVGAQALK